MFRKKRQAIHSEPPAITDAGNRLQTAIEVAKAGRKAEAKQLLESVLYENSELEPAWIWYADVVSDDAWRLGILRHALELNPNNSLVQTAVSNLEAKLGEIGALVVVGIIFCPNCSRETKAILDLYDYTSVMCMYCRKSHTVRVGKVITGICQLFPGWIIFSYNTVYSIRLLDRTLREEEFQFELPGERFHIQGGDMVVLHFQNRRLRIVENKTSGRLIRL